MQLKSQQIIQKLEPIRSDLLQINYAKAARYCNID